MTVHSTYSRFIWILATILIVVGVALRLGGLPNSIMWYDEANSLMHSCGCTYDEIKQDIQEKVISFNDLRHRYGNRARSIRSVCDTLRTEQPEHMPAFYIALNLWGRHFGWSVTTVKLLPLAISFLQLPAYFWLGLELSGNPLGGAVAAALVAMSPLELRYALEVREYSLYIVMFGLTSASFLRAQRTNSLKSWSAYVLLLSIGLFSSLLAVVTSFIQFLYATLTNVRIRFLISADGKKNSRDNLYVNYLVSTIFAFLLASPSLLLFLGNWKTGFIAVEWVKAPRLLNSILQAWMVTPFADWLWNSDFYSPVWNVDRCVTFYLPLLILVVINTYCAHLAYMKSRGLAFAFLAIVIAVHICLFWLPDLLWGGSRSFVIRYFMPISLSMLMFVSYGIQLRLRSAHRRLQILALAAWVFIAGCQISSSFSLSQSKQRGGMDALIIPLAEFLNREPGCLLICQQEPGVYPLPDLLALSYLVNPTTRLLYTGDPAHVASEYRHFYLYRPNRKLVAKLAGCGYQIDRPNENVDFAICNRIH
jgi:uncharacterized membrane protein